MSLDNPVSGVFRTFSQQGSLHWAYRFDILCTGLLEKRFSDSP